MTWAMVGGLAVTYGPALIGAGGAIGASLLSGGGDKGGGSEGGGIDISMLDTRNPDQRAIDGAMSQWISKYLPEFEPGKPYEGKMTAPMSGFEGQGMEFLQKYLTGAGQPGANPMLGLAENELTKTFTGGYDPSTSPFYKATRDSAMVEQQDARNKMNQGLGARGKYFSSEALNEEQQLGTRTTNFLNQTLTGMAEKERQNRLSAVPMAMNLDIARTKANIPPIAAATSFGALPREIEQSDLERQYQGFLNQRKEMAMPVQAAMGTFQGGNDKTIGVQNAAGGGSSGFDWGSFLGETASQVDWGSLIGSVGKMLA